MPFGTPAPLHCRPKMDMDTFRLLFYNKTLFILSVTWGIVQFPNDSSITASGRKPGECKVVEAKGICYNWFTEVLPEEKCRFRDERKGESVDESICDAVR